MCHRSWLRRVGGTVILASALLLALAAAQDPEPADLDDATCIQDAAACVTTAGAHFDAGRFDRAVHLFELLVAANPKTPKYHYFAGLAREGAGDDTAAYIHMRRFLVSDADNPDERKAAARRITAILARTTRVSLRTPPHNAPLTLRLTRTNAAHAAQPAIVVPLAALAITPGTAELVLTPGEWQLALDPARLGEVEVVPLQVVVHPAARILKLELTTRPIRHTLTLDLAPTRALRRGITINLHRPRGPNLKITSETPTVRRDLPPGTWTYEAHARGFLSQKQDLVLDGPMTFPVKLTPKWSGERRKRLKLGLGLAGAGLVTGIAGSVLLVLADHRLQNPKPEPGDKEPPLKEPALVMADVGGGALGATLGTWIGSASSMSNSRRLWIVESGVGALAIGGGVAWLSTDAPVAPIYTEHAPRSLGDIAPRTIVAASLLGFGTSLVASTIINLARRAVQRRSSANRRASFSLTSGATSARISITF